jgi:vWA-MoxR associated protein C-terminal domain
MSTPHLLLEPVVRWPRTALVDRSYLVEVDLQVAGDPPQWPYDTEELAMLCLLSGGPELRVEALDSATVVVHRFGGSYGAVRYLVTPLRAAAGLNLSLTVATRRGVPVRTDRLPVAVVSSVRDRDRGDSAVAGDGQRAETTSAAGDSRDTARPEVTVTLETDLLDPGRVFVATSLSIAGERAVIASEERAVAARDTLEVMSGHLGDAFAQAYAPAVEIVAPQRLAALPFDRCLVNREQIGIVCPLFVSVVRPGPSAAPRWQTLASRWPIWLAGEDLAPLRQTLEIRGTPPVVAITAASVGPALPARVTEVLDAQVPAMLWYRDSGHRDAFAELVRSLPDLTPHELPEQVLLIRRRAATEIGDAVGRHLSILFNGQSRTAAPLVAP